MKHRPAAVLAALSVAGLLASAVSAKALMIAPAPIAQRVATAEVVVLGTVTRLEDKPVKAARFPGDKDGAEYTIAIVKIDKNFLGAQDLTHLRVGFIPPPPAVNPNPNPGPNQLPVVRPPIRRFPQVNLTKDQKVCLFLSRHPQGGDFYVAPAYFDVIDAKNPNFAKEQAEVERAARLLANPMAGLQSKNNEERFETAAMLLTKYRTPKPGVANPQQQPIDAKESKLILEALADADWTAQRPGAFQMNPQAMFYRLGLTAKEGWTQPKNFKEFPDAAKKWLKDHADTYRIQKYVAEAPQK
jgi:hypothetical protein